MTFNEANTVRDFVRDRLTGSGTGWQFIAGNALPRAESDVLIESAVTAALTRFNPEIAHAPERADEVIYKLRAAILSIRTDGLVRANEEFREWLSGARSMPFGENGAHVPVRLIDFDDLGSNELAVSTEVTFRVGKVERRFDLVLWVNGIPLVVGEAKTPTRPAISWVDAAIQVHSDYEENVPQFFVPNVFSFATDGKDYRFGSVRMPVGMWAPWRDRGVAVSALAEVKTAVASMLRPEVLLDILANFTVYATDKKHRKIKVICRYQQYEGTNEIVQRVIGGQIRKGLIWHFQGSGKSLLMVFAAQKLRAQRALRSPTVLIVVDRIDLDAQITATFNATDVPNMISADSRDELHTLLRQGVRKVIITTVHKFAEAAGVLDARDNIIALVDEAHRTQEGDFGQRMREALPNAFLFGLTGTPINTRDRNTFWAFGAPEDKSGYLSRYTFQESIRDGATLPLHFEARLVDLRIDQAAIDAEFELLSDRLTDADKALVAKRAGKIDRLIKAPARVQAICEDIARHFQEVIEPNGFKAQVVTYDKEACVLYKDTLDEILTPEASAVVMSMDHTDPQDWKTRFGRSREDEEKLLDRFRDADDPLQILIVTAKLLTGFDAPILQAMYLDKPAKDHTLLQAICRTNRPYPGKTHGLVVDYLGVFDDVARALDFDDKSVLQVITNIDELKTALPSAVAACLEFFPDVDRTLDGYEGLLAAQEHLDTNEQRDAYAAAYGFLAKHWEALSPDPVLLDYRVDYRWLTDVYVSVQPPGGQGKLLWHALGNKTIELINEHVHVDLVRDDLETLVLDADILDGLLADPETKSREVEIKIVYRLAKHRDDPRFVALGVKLEELRERHAHGQLTSLAFLKELLALARSVVEIEKTVEPEEESDLARAALTELFESVKTAETPILVERVVGDIDEIVRVVRFDGWQQSAPGERDVRQALRRALLKYKLHRDEELFEKAYRYIRQYY
jgi:type I restriction enzyme R subunit